MFLTKMNARLRKGAVQFTYTVRHFNEAGGVLRMRMFHRGGDNEAIGETCSEQLPNGCTSVEVEREGKFIWRAEAADLEAEIAEERALSPEDSPCTSS